MFTIRPKIKNGESLTSYLIRISTINKVDFIDTFKKFYRNEKYVGVLKKRIHLIDVMPNEVIDIKELGRAIGKEYDEINKYTFEPTIKLFSDDPNIQRKYYFFFMMLKLVENTNRKFCPICLHQEKYHKLIWKVKEINFCDLHKIKLETRCMNCNTPVSFLVGSIDKCVSCKKKIYNKKKVENLKIDENEARKYKDWYFLLGEDGNTIELNQNFNNKEQDGCLKLLYLSLARNELYQPKKSIVFTKSERNHFRSSVINGIKKRPFLPYIFKVIRHPKINLALKDFFNLNVPNSFKDSLLTSNRLSYGNCLNSACKGYGTKKDLEKINVYYKKTSKYSNVHYCNNCYQVYGIERKTNEWKNTNNMIKKVDLIRKLIEEGKTKKEIEMEMSISPVLYYRLVGYLSQTSLLSPNYQNIKEDKNLLEKFKKIISEYKTLDMNKLLALSQKLYGWSTKEFYYYFYDREIQRYLIFEAKFDINKKDIELLKKKVNESINYLKEKNIPIKKSNIYKAINSEVHKKNVIVFLIEEGIKEQKLEEIKKMEEIINDYISEKHLSKKFSVSELCDLTKKSQSTIRVYSPDFFNWIKKVVLEENEKYKQFLYNEKLKKINNIRLLYTQNGISYTKKDVANQIGISEGTISYYYRVCGKKWGDFS
ncbi:TniQ family protein [Sutcliffiella horikoshii]|uniref:TniQ family protein n=1 Tax=Sutcliffiella horikoshii TaxID=79883 RepID=UPI0012F8C3CE|nr:TniQ family protein [Sutcliffiella horikoshii]